MDPVRLSDTMRRFTPGTSFGKYVISQPLGESIVGRGTFLAECGPLHPLCGTLVVLKIWPPLTPDTESVYERESQLLLHLKHPHIQRVSAVSVHENHPVFVMEYHEGISLEQYLQQGGSLRLQDIKDYFAPIADAIAYAHREDVLHRNIRPSSIILSERPVLVGFGSAKNVDAGISGSMEISIDPYLAPELLEDEYTSAADIYALGVTIRQSLREQGLEDFIESMLCDDPDLRPCAQDVYHKLKTI